MTKTDAGRLLYKIFSSHFICKVSKRVTQSLRVRGSWRPNITEIFWPQSYGRQHCVFLILHGCSTGALEFYSAGVLAFLITSRLSPSPTLLACLNCPQFVGLILPSNSHAVIWICLRYFFRYLATGNVSLPLTLKWPVWSSSSGNNCHPVQRSLSSSASAYESIMGFFFTSSHFISQFLPHRDFFS